MEVLFDKLPTESLAQAVLCVCVCVCVWAQGATVTLLSLADILPALNRLPIVPLGL